MKSGVWVIEFWANERREGALAAGTQGSIIRSLGESAVMAAAPARTILLAGGSGAAQARLSRSSVVANGSSLECSIGRRVRSSARRNPDRFAPLQGAAGVQ